MTAAAAQRAVAFTAQQKLESVRREIGYRRRVFPRMVETGKFSQAFADREIAVMEAIATDYEQAAAKLRLL